MQVALTRGGFIACGEAGEPRASAFAFAAAHRVGGVT